MSVILNFNLSQLVSSRINSIVCLFDPSPTFQYTRNADFSYSIVSDANLVRDTSIALAGFSATDISVAGYNPINLPANSYTVNVPSKVYGSPPNGDTHSILQVNTALAKIEPGFSRLQVNYLSYSASTGSYVNLTEYFDCPFYEGFNTTARELNNIKNYIEESASFLQNEINVLYAEVDYALSVEFWRGTSVSGQLLTTPTTVGLQTGALNISEFPHNIPVSCKLNINDTVIAEKQDCACGINHDDMVLAKPAGITTALITNPTSWTFSGPNTPAKTFSITDTPYDTNIRWGQLQPNGYFGYPYYAPDHGQYQLNYSPDSGHNGGPGWSISDPFVTTGMHSTWSGINPGHGTWCATATDAMNAFISLWGHEGGTFYTMPTSFFISSPKTPVISISGQNNIVTTILNSNSTQLSIYPIGVGSTTLYLNDGYSTNTILITVNQPLGQMSVNPTNLSFTGPLDVEKSSIITDTNMIIDSAHISVSGLNGIVTTRIANNKIYVAPTLTSGNSNTTLILNDGHSTTQLTIAIGQPIGPILIDNTSSPYNISFTDPWAPKQTLQITDAFHRGSLAFSNSNGGVASFNWDGTINLDIFPGTTLGTTTITISDTSGNTAVINVSIVRPIPAGIGGISPSTACIGQMITITGSNFSSHDFITINGVGALSQTLINASVATVIVPSCTLGPATLAISDGYNTSTFGMFVMGAPILSNVNPTQALPGSPIKITGNQFYTQNTNSVVYVSGLPCIIESWNNNEINVYVPWNGWVGATQVQVQTQCGNSSSAQFITMSLDTIQLNTHAVDVPELTHYQFTATLSQGTPGTQTVTQSNVSSGPNTVWQVNNLAGGEATHGFITQAGFYTAPASLPTSPIIVTVQFYDRLENIYIQDSCTVTTDASPFLWISQPYSIIPGGQQQQYTAYFHLNGIDTDVTSSTSFSVNSTPAPSDVIDGLITTGGNYTAPGHLTIDTIEDISASYIFIEYYNNIEVISTTYTAVIKTTVKATPTTFSNITVNSQINVYLGDGRFGYIPTGTQISVYPNQYIYVQFQEQIPNQSLVPFSTYLPIQQLTMQVHNALAPDIANVINNLANITLNSDGTRSTFRTVILGIIDPSDGLFHSMWDIANQISTGSNINYSLSYQKALFGENTKAFQGPHSFKGSLTDYVNDLSGGAQTQIDALNAHSNIMLVGNCSYDEEINMFKILDNLQIIGILGDKTYGTLGIIPKQDIKLEPNQYLYINSAQKLIVNNFVDVFSEIKDTKTIVVGAVLDRFYTTWPLLKTTKIDTSNVKELGAENNYMEIGDLLIQWGLSTEQFTVAKKSATTNKILFPKKFQKSCVVHTEAYNSTGGFPNTQAINQTLEDFEAKLINTSTMEIKSNISWFAIGM